MKMFLKGLMFLSLLCTGLSGVARAGQEVYLSTSPNERYRIYVEQDIDHRVGDRIFFRYPMMLVNVRRPAHHFWIMDVGSPLIQENDKGTFKLHWDETNPTEPSSIHFDWSPDSLKAFIHLEVIEGTWKTFYVDVNTGTTTDITSDLEQYLVAKTSGWACEQPKFQLVKWTKPNLAFFRLTTTCGKNKEKLNDELFYQTDSVLFDTEKGKTVDDCMGCKDDKSVKVFDKYYIKSIPTPTPTPEETPVAQ